MLVEALKLFSYGLGVQCKARGSGLGQYLLSSSNDDDSG